MVEANVVSYNPCDPVMNAPPTIAHIQDARTLPVSGPRPPPQAEDCSET